MALREFLSLNKKGKKMGRTRGSISKEAHKLANDISGKHGLVLPSLAQQLITLSRRYAKIQERWCNEDMSATPGLQEKVEAQEKKLEEEIRDLAKTIPGVQGVKFTGDPRGYTVRLMLKSERYNTWGGLEDGWGVA